MVQNNDNASALAHCEAVFEQCKSEVLEGSGYGRGKPESYHRAQLMEAADKLKDIDLT